MELEVQLGSTGPMEKSVGRTITGSFGTSEYDMGIVVTRTGGGTGFILETHNGKFVFGPAGSPTKQIVSAVRRIMYGGNGTPAQKWLKRILLLHDIPRGTGTTDEDLHDFLDGECCNNTQEEDFTHATSQTGGPLGSRLSIIQGPSGTGKTNIACASMRYFLEGDVKTMFIAASNKAVDVAAARLLEQLQSRQKHTQGICKTWQIHQLC